MLPVYVFSNGYTADQVFNAVAAFMGTATFGSALYIAFTFSVIGAVLMYINSHDLKTFLKWFGIYFIITVILLDVKIRIQILDVTDMAGSAEYQVDNVPYGLAIPAWLFSSLSYGITEGISDVFHTPNDLSYNQTGMLYGAQLFNATQNNAMIFDDNARDDFNHFVTQCIIPDITVNHKYSFEELANSPDIMGFLSEQSMSPIRGLYMNGQYETCAQALPLISKAIQADVPNSANWIASVISSNTPGRSQKVLPDIENTYQYLINSSDSAQDILLQNMMINAIREGIGTSMASSNSGAAMVNYAYTVSMQKQLLSDNTVARTATYLLPLMQTALFLILVSMFPIIILLACQPMMFSRILKNYLHSFVYLATWPPLFCVINFIMTTALSTQLSSLSILQGGITLSNQNALLHETEQFAAYAGYLIALIPILAGFIFRGLDSVFMSAAQTMVGTMQNWSSQASSSMAEGNIQMGNVGMNNHSWNNWSANKHDTNATHFAGMTSHQMQNGAIQTTTPSGQTIYNTSGAISQLPDNINLSSSLSDSFSKQSDTAMQSAISQRDSMDRSVSNAASIMTQYSNTQGDTDTNTNAYTLSHAASNDQAMSNMNSITKEYAASHGISYNQASETLTRLSLNEHAGVSTGMSLSLGGKTSFNAGIEGSAEQSASHLSTASYHNSDTRSDNDRLVSDYRTNMDYLARSSSDSSTQTSQSRSDQLSNQVGVDFRAAESAQYQYSTDLSESNRYSQMASYVDQNAASINDNLSQQFVDFVQKADPTGAANILSNTSSPQVAAQRAQYASEFIKSYQNQFESSISSSGVGGLYESGQSDFRPQNIQKDFLTNQSMIETAASNKTAFSQSEANSIQSQVMGNESQAHSQIGLAGSQSHAAWGAYERKTQQSITSGESDASKGATDAGLDALGSYAGPAASFLETGDGIVDLKNLSKPKRG